MAVGPGVYFDMAAETYHSDPCPAPSLNQSLVPILAGADRRSPLHAAFKSPRLNPYGSAGESTLAMYLGDATHRLALERGREPKVIRYSDYRTDSARAERDEAVRAGRIPILEKHFLRAREMAQILKARIREACEGEPYATEVVLIWEEQTAYGPIFCRAQLDVWCTALGLVLDPKILSTPATSEAFGRVSANSGYDMQARFYLRGIRKVLGPEARFANLVIENEPPYEAQLFIPDDATLFIAEKACAAAMELWAKCLRARSWPGYPSGLTPYSTPTYYQNRITNQ